MERVEGVALQVVEIAEAVEVVAVVGVAMVVEAVAMGEATMVVVSEIMEGVGEMEVVEGAVGVDRVAPMIVIIHSQIFQMVGAIQVVEVVDIIPQAVEEIAEVVEEPQFYQVAVEAIVMEAVEALPQMAVDPIAKIAILHNFVNLHREMAMKCL